MESFNPPRPIRRGESLESAVYCADCKLLEQDLIGCKTGTCSGKHIPDTSVPMRCDYFKNDTKLISVFIFLKSGISIYHKAIVKDLRKGLDPDLLSGFLSAINMFGQELTNEQVSLITFQKMNIVFCRGNYSNGALIIKGNIDNLSKDVFSYFINKLESSFPDFFEGEFVGRCLPEEEIDQIAIESLKEFFKEKMHPIPAKLIENLSRRKCGTIISQE